jgi:hypothetical protein
MMRTTVIVYTVLLFLIVQGCADTKEKNSSYGKSDMQPSGEKREQIGVATMQPDGTIKIYMGFKGDRGEMVDGFAEYKPDNTAYQDIIKRLEGIKPGENKPYFKP